MRKRQTIRRLVAGFSILALIGCAEDGGAPEASALSAPQDLATAQVNRGGKSKDFCFFSVGDLNGDGLEDYAISDPWDPTGLAVQRQARIVFGDGRSLQRDDVVQGALEDYPGFRLTGARAAPFLCGPSGGTREGGRESVAQALSAGVNSPLAENPIAGPPRFEMVNLSDLSPGKYSDAYGIGAGGKVVGSFLTLVDGRYADHAFLYEDGEMRDLGSLGGHYSIAYGINRFDQIVGYSLTGETDDLGFVHAAFLWDGFPMRDLGIGKAAAYKINDSGRIVGERSQANSIMAFLYDNGAATDLGSLDGRGSAASSINNQGQIVGTSTAMIPDTIFASNRGFLYQDGALVDLGSFGAYCFFIEDFLECFEHSSATDINDKGQIVGHSNLSDSFNSHAFRTGGDELDDLGTLGGSQSWAQAVNESGQIVGSSLITDDAAYHAFLFDQEKMYDLNALIVERPAGSGDIWGAMDINDFGQIVGSSYLLNPLYPTVSPGRDLTFSATLGSQLRFEYWFTLEDQPKNCSGRSPSARIQIKIVSPGLNRSASRELRSIVNSWITVGTSDVGCGSSGGWKTAELSLPPALEGQEVDMTIRIRERGRSLDPIVHLRHFVSD